MAKTNRPYVPEQDLLLPPSLRDWSPENHLAYFVSDLIDQLDLSAITAMYEDEERGDSDAGYCSDENVAAVADTTIHAYISTRKQKHGEQPGPCPRGPLPRTATRVDRMTRKLHTKAGAAVYAARKAMVEQSLGRSSTPAASGNSCCVASRRCEANGCWCEPS